MVRIDICVSKTKTSLHFRLTEKLQSVNMEWHIYFLNISKILLQEDRKETVGLMGYQMNYHLHYRTLRRRKRKKGRNLV